jgi:hypothetical protein
MMKNYVISISVLSILSYSCASETETEEVVMIPKKVEYSMIETTSWLPGTWENSNEIAAMHEIWEVLNDSTLQGTVTATRFELPNSKDNGGIYIDTLEIITIEERNGSIFYIPAVKDQNQGLPVKFRLTSSSDSELKFENPDHDFPQLIHYIKVNEDSIFATVSGQFEGQQVEEKFPFKRVK